MNILHYKLKDYHRIGMARVRDAIVFPAINGVPASEIPEIQAAVPRCHYISSERGEDCGIWVKQVPDFQRGNHMIPIAIILPEEFGTPDRTVGCVQVYSTRDGWL